MDSLDSLDDPSTSDSSLAPSLLCLVEGQETSKDGRITISLVSVTPSTGDVIWDEFEDGFMRGELEVANQSYFVAQSEQLYSLV